MYINITSKNFEDEVIKSEIPVLVDFWAEWCGPCRALSPIIDEISIENKGKIKICKVNVDFNNDLATRYTVMSIPTLIIFKNGKMMEKIVGLISKMKLGDIINKYI